MDKKIETLFVMGGKKYAFDLEKIKNYCLTSDKEKGGEVEVMEVHEPNERGVLELASKTVHEIKSTGNPQNDTIMYDLIKSFVMLLLSSEIKGHEEAEVLSSMDFATRLSFNTMVNMGFLIEIE
jgi:hypothetical protein